MRDFSKQPLSILTIKQFYDEKEIILNPRYQRNEVWTRSQKQYLVDSLLIGIDIPKIYFNRKNEKYEVVDGQ